MRLMRIRHKLCAQCQQSKSVMYRCRYNGNTEWKFVCGPCLLVIKQQYCETYQYGGTWKAQKQ
ncbi:hypothetical protein CWC21_02055 [Pseudoalteromonas phenolica]|nr:hypothetical protein CWC21_02055 [Pseudoalteromonas phenolica]